jgi:hypothetical protein
MSWISAVRSIIMAAHSGSRKQGLKRPSGLEEARVSFVNDGRSGRVVLSQGLKSFEMYFEFGGGDTVATIDAPSVAE